MNKLKLQAFVLICAVAGGLASCDSDDEPMVYKPSGKTVKDYDLSAEVKSADYTGYRATWNNETQKAEKGNSQFRETVYFSADGIQSGWANYVMDGTGKYQLVYRNRWEWDSKYRITADFYESYEYALNTETPGILYFMKILTTYDDDKKKATRTNYRSSDGVNFELYWQGVFDLDAHGFIINEDEEVGVLSAINNKTKDAIDVFPPDNRKIKRTEVIVKKDARGNWLEMYTLCEELDANEKVIDTFIMNYYDRVIVYY